MKTLDEFENYLIAINFLRAKGSNEHPQFEQSDTKHTLRVQTDSLENSEVLGAELTLKIPLTPDEIVFLPSNFLHLVKKFKKKLLKKGRQQHKLHEAHEILSPYVEKLEQLKVVRFAHEYLIGKGVNDFLICVAMNMYQFNGGDDKDDQDDEDGNWFNFELNTKIFSFEYDLHGDGKQVPDQIFKDWASRHGINLSSSSNATWGDVSRIEELFEIITELNNLYSAQISQA